MSSGRIVFVGTPIGNLADMSPRGADALAAADVVACEDTRRTGRLLQHLGIDAPHLVRMDDHTELDVAPRLLQRAAAGDVVAVVTDAGMPGLSDPGSRLLSAAVDAAVPVEVVPGPFAGAVGAVLSGLLGPSGQFVFEGFLPRRGEAREARLSAVGVSDRPVVIYESPHRLGRTVVDLARTCGPQRKVALCREITKMHEETWRGTLAEAAEHLGEAPPRGEYVVVVAAAPAPGPVPDAEVVEAITSRIAAGDSRRDAAAAVARDLGVAPNRVKRLAADRATTGEEGGDPGRG